MLINTHPRWDICKLTFISACLVCRKFQCNRNNWNVLNLCHCYVMTWQVCCQHFRGWTFWEVLFLSCMIGSGPTDLVASSSLEPSTSELDLLIRLCFVVFWFVTVACWCNGHSPEGISPHQVTERLIKNI